MKMPRLSERHSKAQAACFALRRRAPPRSGSPINTRWSLVISTQPSLLMPNGALTAGLRETGDAERAMNLARSFMPLVGWREGVVHAFLALPDMAEQMAFWRKHLDTRRFRAGFDTLMSPMYCAPYTRRGSFRPARRDSAPCFETAGKGVRPASKLTNPYARALLLGEYSNEPRPRSPNIRFVLADAASWLESCPGRFFDAFALSNILDAPSRLTDHGCREPSATRPAGGRRRVAKFCGTTLRVSQHQPCRA